MSQPEIQIPEGATDPADLVDLQYPQLHNRRDSLSAAIEVVTAEQGPFDPRLPGMIRELESVQDALRRKREGSAGKRGPHKKKGEEGDAADAGDATDEA